MFAYVMGCLTTGPMVLLGVILGYRFAQVHDQQDDDNAEEQP